MQGKESKHSEIKQELKTGTNRSCEVGENGKWHQLARSSYVRNFYLPYCFLVKTYKVNSHSQNPPVATSENVCGCFRPLVNCDDICLEYVKSFQVFEDAKNGYLSEKLRTIILPIKCPRCTLRFADSISSKYACELIKNNQIPNVSVKRLYTNPKTMKVDELRNEISKINSKASTKGSISVLCYHKIFIKS